MRKKFVSAAFALIGLGTIVVLGSSTDFIGKMVEALQQDPVTQMFSSANPADDLMKKMRKSKRMPQKHESMAAEIPENILWYVVFNFTNRLESEAEKTNQQGQDGSLYTNYFVRQGHLSNEKDLILKEMARKYTEETDPLEQKAKKIVEELEAEYARRAPNRVQSPPPPSAELKELRKQKDKILVRYRDDFKLAIGEEAFNNFSLFLATEFSEGATSQSIAIPSQPESYAVGFTWIIWDDSLPTPLITGFSQLYYFYDGFGFVYRPSLDSLFFNATTSTGLDFGSDTGYFWFPALYFHPVFVSARGNQYCTITDFYLDLFDGGTIVDEIYLGTSPAVCHVVGAAPPPTPTPTPTPTPSPTPTCDPLMSNTLVPCQPTPTPTPTPTPSVSVTPIDVVEKYGERNFSVTIRNNDAGSTRFTLTTTAGTGTATFENGTNATVMLGNAENQPLKIKGVLESSQIDNIRIEARVNNDSTVRASDDFTVAVITSLAFERYDSTYPALDSNPGTDGMVNADGSEGQRIFPDALSGGRSSKAKSSVKIKATVLPAAANLKVYFGSFDLDDPSATGPPIDNTMGIDGNDNNGQVNNSTSGDFVIVPGPGPCATNLPGTAPNYISTVECTTASDGTVTAVFQTTMQPGDNFAIAASMDSNYRNGMKVKQTDGSQVVNAASQPIHVSGRANPDNVAGIRTNMLTVWRKLNIEIDSMGQAHENYIRGEASAIRSLKVGSSKTLSVTANDMEVNRFENGRIEFAAITSLLDVLSNTANTLTVKNSTASDIVLANNVNFELLSASGGNSAVGTIPTGQTITPMQTVTLTFAGTPLIVNAFSGGQMDITPVLDSLTVTGNTINTVNVTNNGTEAISIVAGTHFRLYDDDDMDDDDTASRNGDEGDNIPEPNTDLLQPTDTACVVNPANGQITNNCNVLMPAYIRPAETFLAGSHEKVPFVANIEAQNIGQLDPFLSAPYFNNFPSEANTDFWTIYLLGGYQLTLSSDGDPKSLGVGINFNATFGASNVSNIAPLHANDGYGSLILTELGRATEYPAGYESRPVGRAYTTAHEVGHLFSCIHGEGGLMEVTQTRTGGTFSDTSLSFIRKATHP